MSRAAINSTAVNASAIGAGASQPFTSAGAEQACRVVGSLEVAITKSLGAQQVCTVTGGLRVLQQISGPLPLALTVVSGDFGRIWTNNFLSVRGQASVVGSVYGRVFRRTPVEQTCALASTVNAMVFRQLPASIYQVCGLTGAASGISVSGQATSERRIFVPRSSRGVALPAQNSRSLTV